MTTIVHVHHPIRLYFTNKFKDALSTNFEMVLVVHEALWGPGMREVQHSSCCVVGFMNAIRRWGAPVTGETRFFLPMQ